jgi:hypothetical protein
MPRVKNAKKGFSLTSQEKLAEIRYRNISRVNE